MVNLLIELVLVGSRRCSEWQHELGGVNTNTVTPYFSKASFQNEACNSGRNIMVWSGRLEVDCMNERFKCDCSHNGRRWRCRRRGRRFSIQLNSVNGHLRNWCQRAAGNVHCCWRSISMGPLPSISLVFSESFSTCEHSTPTSLNIRSYYSFSSVALPLPPITIKSPLRQPQRRWLNWFKSIIQRPYNRAL